MTDKSKPSQSSDGSEDQDLPGNDVNDHAKGISNSKAERIRKNAQSRSISSDESEKTVLPEIDANIQNNNSKSERIRENARRRSIQGPQEKIEQPIKKPESQDTQAEQQESAETQSEQQEPVEDELFADIRRSLVEEDLLKKEKKQRGVLQRVAKLFKSDRTLPAAEPNLNDTIPDDVDLAAKAGIKQQTIKEPDVSSSEVESFFAELIETSQLDTQNETIVSAQTEVGEEAKPALEAVPASAPIIAAQDDVSAQVQPDEKVGDEKLLQGSTVLRPHIESKKADESFENIREVALEDYNVLPESTPSVPQRQKLKILIKGLRPFERILFAGVIGLMVITGLLFGANLLMKKFQPPETLPEATQNLPIPIRVTLPGGWAFDLHKGKVENGRWNPTGGEWLEGTELCKWVAVPWSLQLEAVLRTLKLNDPIELTMSNADNLKFKVQSIKEVSVDQIGTLEKTSNCLLLILANQKADTRWVVTAIP